MSGGLGGRVFTGPGMGDDDLPQNAAARAASLTDPAYGADPTLTPSPAMPAPVPRDPGMSEFPPAGDDISDDDLMTDEERVSHLAKLIGLSPDALGGTEPHDVNLATKLKETDLTKIGSDLLEKIEADEESEKKYKQRFKRGLQILGLEDFAWAEGKAPFDGAASVTHSMLAEACIQSQARFMEELFPAAGPVKTVVMGEESAEKLEAKDRVSNHMNYQLTTEDETYFMETQKLALYLPAFGCAYRKGYHDFVEDRNVLRFIPGDDLILPYNARDLKSSPRKTHQFKVSQDEYVRGCHAGAYRKVDMGEPSDAQPDEVDEALDKLDGKTPVESQGDAEYTFYETDLRLDLPGYEDLDETGEATGVALPYTVTIEKETGKVLAIRRCWKENDALKLMRTRYAEYWYLPGFGSKGMGLIHWIGSLADASTDTLRALLDSATWANLQGGFKAKDAGAKAGELRMKPGVWVDVDMTAEEIDKAFHTPPFREPSETLFKLLGFLTDMGRRFSGTVEVMVGEQDAKGAPVGTTLALIEQGSKVYSGVHKRGHFAAGIEFRMLFDLNAEYMPEGGYPYLVAGDDRAVFREDYDNRVVSVLPVSDPNIFSQTQRIALAQARYQISQENPQYFRKFEVLKSLLTAFKDPEIDTNMVNPDEVPMMDPVSENVAMVTGRPVKAKDGENHDAHLVTHMAFFQHPQFGGLPQAQQLIGPAMIAHIAEHVALKYAQVQRQLGVPVPPLNLSADPGTSISAQPGQQGGAPGSPDPNMDGIAMAAAQVTGAFMQQAGLTTTPPGQDGQDDAKRLNESKIWVNIATGLAAMAKAGMTLQEAEAAEASIEAGAAGAAPGQGGAAGAPAGALGPTGGAPAPRPAGPAKTGALVTDGSAASPPQHDENNPLGAKT